LLSDETMKRIRAETSRYKHWITVNKLAFIENATQQIQLFDDFYFTMDELNISDEMAVQLILDIQRYYEEFSCIR